MSLLLFSFIQSFSRTQKLEDLRNAVLNELIKSCQCQITAEIIYQEQVVCFNASSNYVTYQARLIGTLEKSSAFLASLIEDWASSGPSILVQGMLLGLGDDCTSDISAGVCSVFGTYECPSTNTGAIVGTVIGVAVLLIVAGIAVAAMRILRRRIRNCFLQNENV